MPCTPPVERLDAVTVDGRGSVEAADHGRHVSEDGREDESAGHDDAAGENVLAEQWHTRCDVAVALPSRVRWQGMAVECRSW